MGNLLEHNKILNHKVYLQHQAIKTFKPIINIQVIIHYLQNYPIIQTQLNQILSQFTKILNHLKLFLHLSIIFIFFFKILMSYKHMDSSPMLLF